MSDKNFQKAGDNSQQVQIQTVNITNGISEERVREICTEITTNAIAENTLEAREIATQRIDRFIDILLHRIQQIEKNFESFSDPAFQVLLKKAQITAGCTEREDDYEVLTELLAHRVENPNDIKRKTSISKAVEIVDQIDDDSLCALTILHALTYFVPLSGSISEGVAILSGVCKVIGINNLPRNKMWIDNLSILDCMTVAPHFISTKIEDLIACNLSGYTCVGIKKGSENYLKAIELLKSNSMHESVLMDHELNEGYVRLSVPHKLMINELNIGVTTNDINDVSRVVSQPLLDNQKNCLFEIYELYEKDDADLKKQVRANFVNLLSLNPYLNLIMQWWSSMGIAFDLTSVGKVIAHANAKRIDNNLPDLD